MDLNVSEECDCGAQKQDLTHLVYDYPHMSPLPVHLSSWSSLPPACSVAFLSTSTLIHEQRRLWPPACMSTV